MEEVVTDATETVEPGAVEQEPITAEPAPGAVEPGAGEPAAETGVLVQASRFPNRDNRGRLLPGFSANPTGHSKADRALISAIHAKYPPTTVMAMLDTAWVAAVKGGGWRGPVEVARLIIEYTIGKPIARSISVSSKAGDMLQQLASLHLGAGDGDAIDVEVEVEVEPAE